MQPQGPARQHGGGNVATATAPSTGARTATGPGVLRPTVSGARKRVVVYGKTREQARDKINKAQQDARAGIPVPDEVMEARPLPGVLAGELRQAQPAPCHLHPVRDEHPALPDPGLGTDKLTALSVANVQQFLNQRLEKGDSVRKVQVMRTVLSAALTRAVREELITRNVARLVELPAWHAAPSGPGLRTRRERSLPLPSPIRSTPRSSCSSSMACAVAKSSGCAGKTSTSTPEPSMSASKSSAVGGETAHRAGQDPRRTPETSRCSSSPARHSKPRPTPGRYRADDGFSLAGHRPRVHHPDRTADRTAEPRPVVPPDLRGQPPSADQGSSPAAHRRVAAQGAGCTSS